MAMLTGFCSIFATLAKMNKAKKRIASLHGSQSLHPLRLWLCNMCLLSNYVPVLAVYILQRFCKTLYASISKLYRK